MLQNANEHSRRLVLGKHTEAFDALTGPGGQYEKNPQGAVRKLLGDPLPPGATPPRPIRGPAPKPAPTPAPKAEVKPPKAAIKGWASDDGYKYMRAEQLRQAEASGVKLSPFEKSQTEQFKASATKQKQLKELDNYVNNAAPYSGRVYRGMNMGETEFNTLLKSLEAGNRTNSIESWTKNSDLKTFTIGGKNQVLISVDNKRGVDISSFSPWGDTEQEVLQPNGARYKVKNVVKEELDAGWTAKGVYRYRVELEQLDD